MNFLCPRSLIRPVQEYPVPSAGKGDQRIKADKRIATPFFTSLHGFKEKGMAPLARDLGKQS